LKPVGLCGLAFAALVVAAACGAPPGPRLRAIDLLKQFGNAETRPVSGRFDVEERACGGRSQPSLAVPPTSRVTWPLRLPDRAVFTTHIAVDGLAGASAIFRVGISDNRVYEPLAEHTISAEDCDRGWAPIEVDLGRYSGWKFSIFYQPGRREWRLVLGVTAATGAAERAYWALPGIDTDARAAQRLYRRGR
jgi:hypothetical protein